MRASSQASTCAKERDGRPASIFISIRHPTSATAANRQRSECGPPSLARCIWLGVTSQGALPIAATRQLLSQIRPLHLQSTVTHPRCARTVVQSSLNRALPQCWIDRLGSACRSSSKPLRVTPVSRRRNSLSLVNPLRCGRPASVTLVPSRLRCSRLVSPCRYGNPASLTRVLYKSRDWSLFNPSSAQDQRLRSWYCEAGANQGQSSTREVLTRHLRSRCH